MFISNMDHSDMIIAELYHDHESTLKSKLAKFKANAFINTMSQLVNKLFGNNSVSSARSSKPQSRPPSKSSFSRNKTNAANVVRASTEYGMSSDPDFTSVGLHSIAFDDIDLDTCNDAELGLLLEAINQIGSNLNSAFDTSRPCVICGGTSHTFDGCKVFLTPLVSKLHTSSFVLLSIDYMAYLESPVNPISAHSAAILSAPLILLSAPLVLVLVLSLVLLVLLLLPALHPSTSS
jgi:hypothetical protein